MRRVGYLLLALLYGCVAQEVDLRGSPYMQAQRKAQWDLEAYCMAGWNDALARVKESTDTNRPLRGPLFTPEHDQKCRGVFSQYTKSETARSIDVPNPTLGFPIPYYLPQPNPYSIPPYLPTYPGYAPACSVRGCYSSPW